MVDFDNFIVMNKKDLAELNEAIDKVLEQKRNFYISSFLEKGLERMIKNTKSIQEKKIPVITPMKKEEMIKITLDFFKSVDPEFYKKAIDIILQQSENIKMNIYNVHRVKDFEKRDETGLVQYTSGGTVQNKKGFARVNVPTRTELYPDEERILDEDECSLEDLYILVHEISHLFDLDLERDKPDRIELAGEREKIGWSGTRELLVEATSIAFEGMLSDYLLNNTSISKAGIQEAIDFKTNSYLRDARLVYAKLLLAREKHENEDITLEFIEKIMRDNNFSKQDINEIAREIIDDTDEMYDEKRYAIGQLIAPTIIKKYKEEGSIILKKYLQEVKSGNFRGALNAIGIEMNEQGINKLASNTKEYVSRLDMEER